MSAAAVAAAGTELAVARARADRDVLDEMRGLSGVRRVFPALSGVSRWFGGPVTEFAQDDDTIRAVVTIAADRHLPATYTAGLVGEYLRARLAERGLAAVDVQVRVALLV